MFVPVEVWKVGPDPALPLLCLHDFRGFYITVLISIRRYRDAVMEAESFITG